MPGELEIVEDEAAIVRRIFDAYAAGRTPRDIAQDLNDEGVCPPRGRRRNASTINGNTQRGIGLIFNELYADRIAWDKVRMVKDPDTGKRLSRPNHRDEWQSIEVPRLRIVEQSVWERAHALKSEKEPFGEPHEAADAASALELASLRLLRVGLVGARPRQDWKNQDPLSRRP